MSDVDFGYLYGKQAYAARAEALMARGASLIVITRGSKGALAFHHRAGTIEVAAPSVDVVDTIGAGDSFHAALLFALRERGCIERAALQAADAAMLRRALSFACQCAAVTCTRVGADPPRRSEVGG